jgi:hypothetical protein
VLLCVDVCYYDSFYTISACVEAVDVSVDYEVERRYSDFVWLNSILLASLPGLLFHQIRYDMRMPLIIMWHCSCCSGLCLPLLPAKERLRSFWSGKSASQQDGIASGSFSATTEAGCDEAEGGIFSDVEEEMLGAVTPKSQQSSTRQFVAAETSGSIRNSAGDNSSSNDELIISRRAQLESYLRSLANNDEVKFEKSFRAFIQMDRTSFHEHKLANKAKDFRSISSMLLSPTKRPASRNKSDRKNGSFSRTSQGSPNRTPQQTPEPAHSTETESQSFDDLAQTTTVFPDIGEMNDDKTGPEYSHHVSRLNSSFSLIVKTTESEKSEQGRNRESTVAWIDSQLFAISTFDSSNNRDCNDNSVAAFVRAADGVIIKIGQYIDQYDDSIRKLERAITSFKQTLEWESHQVEMLNLLTANLCQLTELDVEDEQQAAIITQFSDRVKKVASLQFVPFVELIESFVVGLQNGMEILGDKYETLIVTCDDLCKRVNAMTKHTRGLKHAIQSLQPSRRAYAAACRDLESAYGRLTKQSRRLSSK